MKLRKIGKRKKGITPIIAVILLMMMTVAAAGAAFFWFVRMQSELQGGSESHSSNLAETINTRAEVVAANLETSTFIEQICQRFKRNANRNRRDF